MSLNSSPISPADIIKISYASRVTKYNVKRKDHNTQDRLFRKSTEDSCDLSPKREQKFLNSIEDFPALPTASSNNDVHKKSDNKYSSDSSTGSPWRDIVSRSSHSNEQSSSDNSGQLHNHVSGSCAVSWSSADRNRFQSSAQKNSLNKTSRSSGILDQSYSQHQRKNKFVTHNSVNRELSVNSKSGDIPHSELSSSFQEKSSWKDSKEKSANKRQRGGQRILKIQHADCGKHRHHQSDCLTSPVPKVSSAFASQNCDKSYTGTPGSNTSDTERNLNTSKKSSRTHAKVKGSHSNHTSVRSGKKNGIMDSSEDHTNPLLQDKKDEQLVHGCHCRERNVSCPGEKAADKSSCKCYEATKTKLLQTKGGNPKTFETKENLKKGSAASADLSSQTSSNRKRKKRQSKIKRQVALQSGKVAIIPADANTKLALTESNKGSEDFSIPVVDVSSTSEFPELIPTNYSKKHVREKDTNTEDAESKICEIENKVECLSGLHEHNNTEIESSPKHKTIEEKMLKDHSASTPGLLFLEDVVSAVSSTKLDEGGVVQESRSAKSKSKSSNKVKPSPRDPVLLLDVLASSMAKPKEKKKKSEVVNKSLTVKKSQTSKGPNVLDSSAPAVRRGKEREKPKKKKPSHLKKVILLEREQRKAKLTLIKAAEEYLRSQIENHETSVRNTHDGKKQFTEETSPETTENEEHSEKPMDNHFTIIKRLSACLPGLGSKPDVQEEADGMTEMSGTGIEVHSVLHSNFHEELLTASSVTDGSSSSLEWNTGDFGGHFHEQSLRIDAKSDQTCRVSGSDDIEQGTAEGDVSEDVTEHETESVQSLSSPYILTCSAPEKLSHVCGDTAYHDDSQCENTNSTSCTVNQASDVSEKSDQRELKDADFRLHGLSDQHSECLLPEKHLVSTVNNIQRDAGLLVQPGTTFKQPAVHQLMVADLKKHQQNSDDHRQSISCLCEENSTPDGDVSKVSKSSNQDVMQNFDLSSACKETGSSTPASCQGITASGKHDLKTVQSNCNGPVYESGLLSGDEVRNMKKNFLSNTADGVCSVIATKVENTSVSCSEITGESAPDSHEVLEEKRKKAIRIVIHTKNFREYCNHLLSKEIDDTVHQLLDDLCRFQDRMHQKDPVKARIKRRLVYGIKEVTKHLKLKKVKCIIIAPNIENIQSEGGLNDALSSLIRLAGEYHIPCVFAADRKHLGKVCKKPVPVSVVGIFNYEGSEASFKKIVELYEESSKDYQELCTLVRKHIQEDDIVKLLHAHESAPHLLLQCRTSVLRSIFNKQSPNSKLQTNACYEKFTTKYMIKI